MNNGFVYLASPYSHADSRTRAIRYWEILHHAADAMAAGTVIYSPIVHGHNIAELLPDALLLDHEFWMLQSLPMLRKADELWVIMIDGWKTSEGVTREVEFARDNGIPVKYIP